MKRVQLIAIAIALSLCSLLSVHITGLEEPSKTSAPGSGTIVFASGGDHTNNSIFQAALDSLGATGLDFYFAVGDLGFTGVGNERSWCENIRAKLGSSFPFQLLSGNHDQDGSADGWIGNYVQWCPDHMNSTGTYGSQYYFDYPKTSPLVRVIALPADITVFGMTYDYFAGSPEYVWVSDTIDDARANGIPWVIVGMHKVCITTGPKSCEISTDLYGLLIDKKVDLILHGHVHTNERSKQLSCIIPYSYDPNCIVDDGSDNHYPKGFGPVVIIGGPMGQGSRAVDTLDPEANYFAKLEGGTYGFYKFTVTTNSIDAEYVSVQGSYTDSFTIGSTNQPFTVTVNPKTATINPGEGTATSVQVNGVSSNNVTLFSTGCPPVSTCSFSPLSGSPPFVSTLTVNTSAGTPLATYRMTVSGSNGTRTDYDNYTVTVTQMVTRTYQKGDGGPYSEIDDTYIYEGSRNRNYGAELKLFTDNADCISANTVCKSLIRFPDIIGPAPGQVPNGAQIYSATLEITVTDPGGINNIHQLTETWEEMTATWNSFSVPGSPGAKPAFTSTVPTLGRFAIDVKTAVQAWADGEMNMGVLLDPMSGDGADFDSSESPNPEKLTVVYTTGTSPDYPSTPLNLRASLDGTLSSVVVSWDLPPVETGVDHYEVLRGSSYSPDGSGYAKISSDSSLPAGSTTWTDVDAALNQGPQFYVLRAVGPSGNYSQVHSQVAKFTRALTIGPKPVSTSVIHPSFEIRDNLRGTIGVSVARLYQANDAIDPWKRYDPNRPDQEYDSIDRTVGVWLGVSMAGDLRIVGVVPCTTTMTLVAGWNFVGYPSMTVHTVAEATAGLIGPLFIEGYDPNAAPYFLQRLGPNNLMGPTEGYWIYSLVTQDWSITNDGSPGCIGMGGYRS